MNSHRCPRCGQIIPSWQPIHLPCLMFRLRYPIGILFTFLLIFTLPPVYRNISIWFATTNASNDQQVINATTTVSPDVILSPTHEVNLRETALQITLTIESPYVTSTPKSVKPTPTKFKPASNAATNGLWIAYAYGEVREEVDIYLFNLETQETRQLTSGPATDESPTFSPDGRFLAYASCRGDCEIYQIDLKNNEETQVTDLSVQAKFPDWCRDPSKSLIVFEGRPNRHTHQIWQVDLSTKISKVLTKDPSDSRPVWSPDCTKVAFGRATKDTDGNGIISGNDYLDLFILDVKTEQEIQVISTPDQDEFSYVWSGDGNWIAFTRVSSDTNQDGFINLNDQSELFLVHPDGSDLQNISHSRFSVFSPSWSYDSQYILFTVFRGGISQEIWWYDLKTQDFMQVTPAGPYYHPNWSP